VSSCCGVRIYNRALSADEIKRLYKIEATVTLNAPNSQGSLTRGLVGWWTFDGEDMSGSQTTPRLIDDRSGQGHSGQYWHVTGTPWAVGSIGQALSFDGATPDVSVM
jgi:hypothetical protein